MKKTFGDLKVGDKIYLVAEDKTKERKAFKIRTVDIKNIEYGGENHVMIDFLGHNYSVLIHNDEFCSIGTSSFIKAFANIEDAREDYKARIIAEVNDITMKVNSYISIVNHLNSDLRMTLQGKYNETNR